MEEVEREGREKSKSNSKCIVNLDDFPFIDHTCIHLYLMKTQASSKVNSSP